MRIGFAQRFVEKRIRQIPGKAEKGDEIVRSDFKQP
jgi:hypothetical protein